MTNGEIKVKGNIYRYHKKARVRKKIINRRCKTVSEIIHKIRQRGGYDFSFRNLSKKELEKNLKNMIEFHEYEQPEDVYIKQCEEEGLI
jgi:hypothetical protein